MRRSTILHMSKAALAGTAQPRFKQISKMARMILHRRRQSRNQSLRWQYIPARGLLDVDHVCYEREALELQL